MKIVDSHCHLDFDVFKDDLPEVLARAKEAGVEVMQTICTRVSKFEQVKKIALEHDNIYCSVGIHPNEVENEKAITAGDLIDHAKHPKVIGFGETGLDYYREQSDHKLQIRSFREHIKAARITNIPLIIHTRSADADTISLISDEMKLGKFTGLIHCFTAGADLANAMLELGLYISISGIVTFSNAKELQQVVKTLPLERLLVETDAPYLAPAPNRGKQNEPAFTRFTVEFLANLFGKTPEYVAAVTTENFYNLFTKAQ